MKRVLITGSNRGIGLEMARQSLERGDRVFATCRNPNDATALRELAEAHGGQLSITALGVSDAASIEASYKAVRRQTDALDVLINNAGILMLGDHRHTLGELDFESCMTMLRVNAVGPLLIAQRYLELLMAGTYPRIANITSQAGSLNNKIDGGNYLYAASKAALNMYTRALAFDALKYGIVTVAIHPGWAQTDMGGPNAALPVQESASGVLKVIDNLTTNDAGRFFTWEGAEHPW